MRINELFQVLTGITAAFFLAFPECVRCDHVHLRIHVPEIVQKHKHVKTKFIHVYHPKIIAADVPSSSSYLLHSRKDPTYLVNGGYPQPIVKQQDVALTADDYHRWRRDQMKKAIEHQKRNVKPTYEPSENDEEEDEDENDDDNNFDKQRDVQDEDQYQPERYTAQKQLFKNQKTNKTNGNLKNQQPIEKHRNHKYHQDYETASAEKSYANYSNRHHWNNNNKRKPQKQSSSYQNDRDRTRKSKPKSNRFRYQHQRQQQLLTSESHQQPQYLKTETRPDVDENDPKFYSTLPRDQQFAASDQDDIYSGLLSRKPSRIIVDKSKLLGDINYNRKQQTKIFIQQQQQQQQQQNQEILP